MFIKIGANIFNVNEIVRVHKTVNITGDEFYIELLMKNWEKELTVFSSYRAEDVNEEFKRICSILVCLNHDSFVGR